MKEYIESWKALVLIVEFFCLGGSLFADTRSIAKWIMNAVCIICGIIIIVTA
jgi:hypothetical protein